MDIKQLQYFIAIVEERKISTAAKRLHISQPPLSQQLKAMEEELGTRLIERGDKHFEVTEAGQTLYQYALQMTHLMEETTFEVKEVGSGAKGTLRIGVNTFSVAHIAAALQSFQEQYPKVTYHIEQNESSVLCQHIRDRKVELAFIRLPLELDDFSVLHLKKEPFYFITSKAKKRPQNHVTLDDIKDDPILLPSTAGLGVHYLILEAFSKLSTQANIIGESSDMTLLLELVAQGFAAAIVPETVLEQHDKQAIHAHKIMDTGFSSPISLIWLKNHSLSKAAQHFIQMWEKEFDE